MVKIVGGNRVQKNLRLRSFSERCNVLISKFVAHKHNQIVVLNIVNDRAITKVDIHANMVENQSKYLR